MPKPAHNHHAPSFIRQLFNYDPETGKLFWKARTEDSGHDPNRLAQWNSRCAGKEAFTSTDPSGYKHGTVFGRPYKAHRIAWAIVHGKWPARWIDHINGVRDDNRIANLREADDTLNTRNIKRRVNNRSGHSGVYWHAHNKRWCASIRVHRKSIFLGSFVSLTDAVKAREDASRRYGFPEEYGRDGQNGAPL